MNVHTLPGDHAWYVHGVSSRPALAALARIGSEIPGIDSSNPVVTVDCDELVAFVSAVPLAQFAAEKLETLARDSAWLEKLTREHERIIEALHQRCTTAPAKFCSIVPNADAVLEALAQSREPLLSTLRRLEGRDEFEVRLVAERARFVAWADRTTPRLGRLRAARASRSPHRTSHLDDQISALLERTIEELIEQIATWSFADLKAASADAQVLSLATVGTENADRVSLLRAAFLVERKRQGGFFEALQRLRGLHDDVEVEYVGPRPPYDFVESDAREFDKRARRRG
jgi:hypothetical protein